MDAPQTLVGTSGHIAVHIAPGQDGDPQFLIEEMINGELISLPDLATAREVYNLLGKAILEAEIDLILARRSL